MTFARANRAAAALAVLGLVATTFAPVALAKDPAGDPPTPVQQEYEFLDNKTDYPKPPKVRSTDTGIWKAAVPKGVEGEFDSYDPVGLMAGDLIKADCSLNWRDQDGKLYCFSSGTSLVYFKDWPQTYIREARKAYHELTEKPKPGS